MQTMVLMGGGGRGGTLLMLLEGVVHYCKYRVRGLWPCFRLGFMKLGNAYFQEGPQPPRAVPGGAGRLIFCGIERGWYMTMNL